MAHVHMPEPIRFPEEAEVPEGYAHLVVRTFLFQLLGFALGTEHSVGSDQFVYWVASDPKRKLSPDVFVRLGTPQTAFGSWKTWEQGGPPQLAIEIISPNEGDGVPWEEKLARYDDLGVDELVRFDPDEPEGRRLRVWDRVGGDLVERVVGVDETPCRTLGLVWTVRDIAAPSGDLVGVRLMNGEGSLIETREEKAAARIRELEEELRRRS
jgi:Uma2 family endonuclease